ncbi:MAG: AzlC family ABC transporter permease [Pseudomonadota bacterium]
MQSHKHNDHHLTNRLSSLKKGAIACLPVAFGVFVYGSVFGVLANASGLLIFEIFLMSAIVFSGAAQFAVLDLWTNPLPVFEIALATLLINMRYVLITASLRNRMSDLKWWQWFLPIHLCADENWAITMARTPQDGNVMFLFGSGLTLMLFWQIGGFIGFFAGSILPQPELIGLDFAFTAGFIGLVGSFWKTNKDWLIWSASALGAIVSANILPGSWFIMGGAMCGIIAAIATSIFFNQTKQT